MVRVWFRQIFWHEDCETLKMGFYVQGYLVEIHMV